MNKIIKLPTQIEKYAAASGIECYRRSRTPRFGAPPKDDPVSLLEDIDGAMAEAAYCQYRGIPYRMNVGSYERPDVGKKTQVRSTRWPNGRLIVHDDSKDDEYFVLVRQHVTFEVVGWQKGREAKQLAKRETHRANGTALFVPNCYLNTEWGDNGQGQLNLL